MGIVPFDDALARSALAAGNTPEEFRRAAQAHANATWMFALVGVTVWYFLHWGWALIPFAYAAFRAIQSVSSTMVAMRLERPEWVQARTAQSPTVPAKEIVAAFGEVLEKHDPGPTAVADVKLLPYPKDDIKRAILAVLTATADMRLREYLKVAYLSLAHWQEGVGPKAQGITLSTLTSTHTFENVMNELGPRGEEFEKWQPILRADTDALVSELRKLGFWESTDVQPGAPGDGARPAGSHRP
jgi:hypothetical protein